MADFEWPDDLVPFEGQFYFQHHSVVHESPFTRQQQVLGRSAPRWIVRFSFRGGAGAKLRYHEVGARIEALLMRLRGPQRTVSLYDFRRPGPGGKTRLYDDWAATFPEEPFSDGEFFDDGRGFIVGPRGAPAKSGVQLGGRTLMLSGYQPGTRPILVGDYVGVGDGRIHMVVTASAADDNGFVRLSFEPPARKAGAPEDVTFTKVRGTFRLTSDDAGSNPTDVNGFAHYNLEFVEVLP